MVIFTVVARAALDASHAWNKGSRAILLRSCSATLRRVRPDPLSPRGGRPRFDIQARSTLFAGPQLPDLRATAPMARALLRCAVR